MTNWKENKAVGVVAAILVILCLILMIKAGMKMRTPKVPSIEEQIQALGGDV